MKLELLFPIHLRGFMQELEKLPNLEEIRVRIGQSFFLYAGEKEYVLVRKKKAEGQAKSGRKEVQYAEAYEKEYQKEYGAFIDSREILKMFFKENGKEVYRMTEQDLLEMQNYISDYSLYAWQEELRNGFLTIQGGHRIGLAGGTTSQNGQISGISYLTFFNIRVAHERIGCAKEILPWLYADLFQNTVHNTLIISPPGAGKTTLLRDCIRSLSYGDWGKSDDMCMEKSVQGMKVGLVDERSEVAASYHGIPQNDIGPRTDVLDGCNKPEGIQMLLRTMSPQVIAVDELGTEQDFLAVEQAAYGGCKILGTVHAGSIKDLQEKPNLKRWCEKALFRRFVFIEKGENGVRKLSVYNDRWEQLC